MLQVETLNRQAFELFNAAKRQVSRYEHTLDVANLDKAIKDLDDAIKADTNFFKPANYKGIVYDMKGQSEEAIQQFDAILNQSPASVRDEVEYNKAVAKYHRYSEQYIREAITILESLDRRSEPGTRLSLLVKAVLAQCYAMMTHHSMRNNEKDIDSFVNKANNKANEVLDQANKLSGKLGESFLKQPRWIANNAKGVSLMFHDDNIRDNLKMEEREPYMNRLRQAIIYFDKAAEYSPNNWALECNKASARMRLGHLFIIHGEVDTATKYFDEAEILLKDVISRLRPNYDFAFYELGRIHRFQKHTELAEDYFKKAIDGDTTNRNVSVERLDIELAAVKRGETQFKLSAA